VMHVDPPNATWAVKISNFYKYNIADGCHVENRIQGDRNGYTVNFQLISLNRRLNLS